VRNCNKRAGGKTVWAQADAMVSSGMRDAGYTYINIDDTWEGERDAQGYIQANSKFPDMKALADYVHSKGLKLDIYSSPGDKTCAGYEGSLGHEKQDAEAPEPRHERVEPYTDGGTQQGNRYHVPLFPLFP
jgi:alpha-galactosidase